MDHPLNGWISAERYYYISLNLCGHHWSKVIFYKCIENGISLIYMTELRKAVLGFFHLLFLLSTLKISLGVVLPKKRYKFPKMKEWKVVLMFSLMSLYELKYSILSSLGYSND